MKQCWHRLLLFKDWTVDEPHWHCVGASETGRLLGSSPDLPKKNLPFNKMSRKSVCTFERESHRKAAVSPRSSHGPLGPVKHGFYIFIQCGLSTIGNPNSISLTKLKLNRIKQNCLLQDKATANPPSDFPRGAQGLQDTPASPKH